MYVVSFHPIFNENAMILSRRLNVHFITDLTPKTDDIIIVFGAHEQADKLCLIQQNFRISYIIIQTEQVASKVFDNKYYMELIQNNPLLDWSKTNVEKLKSRLNLKVYSLYYYDFFGVENVTPFNDRKIDFFFTGAKNIERESAINQFKQANINSVFEIDYNYSFKNPFDLTQKLLNVKYVINIPFYKNNALETHRINRALSLGCEVVSLLSSDDDMNKKYEPYVHFVSRLSEFTTLIEVERRSNYVKLLEDFGKRDIENNLRAIHYAEKNIIEQRMPKPKDTLPKDTLPKDTNQLNNDNLTNEVVRDVKISQPLQQPVFTDFSQFLKQKKLNENNNNHESN